MKGIFVASSSGHAHIVEILLAKNPRLDISACAFHVTPLHTTVSMNHENVVALLIDYPGIQAILDRRTLGARRCGRHIAEIKGHRRTLDAAGIRSKSPIGVRVIRRFMGSGFVWKSLFPYLATAWTFRAVHASKLGIAPSTPEGWGGRRINRSMYQSKNE